MYSKHLDFVIVIRNNQKKKLILQGLSNQPQLKADPSRPFLITGFCRYTQNMSALLPPSTLSCGGVGFLSLRLATFVACMRAFQALKIAEWQFCAFRQEVEITRTADKCRPYKYSFFSLNSIITSILNLSSFKFFYNFYTAISIKN